MTSKPRTEAGKRLLAELSESPLPGARYAHDVVSRRLAAIEREAAHREPSGAIGLLRRLVAVVEAATAWIALALVDRLLGGHGPRLVHVAVPDDDEPGGGWQS